MLPVIPSTLTANAIAVAVEAVRVGRQYLEAARPNIATIQIR
jgi:hypothetical protein